MKISMLVAAAENNAIGLQGNLPWHLPNDLKLFRNLTWGLPVIMGRKTFDSLGKALKGRINIVITRQSGWKADNILVAESPEAAIQIAKQAQFKKAFVIGGGNIYEQMLPLADCVYLTRVHTSVDGDAFFPNLDNAQWEMDGCLEMPRDEKHLYDYSFQCWKRKK